MPAPTLRSHKNELSVTRQITKRAFGDSSFLSHYCSWALTISLAKCLEIKLRIASGLFILISQMKRFNFGSSLGILIDTAGNDIVSCGWISISRSSSPGILWKYRTPTIPNLHVVLQLKRDQSLQSLQRFLITLWGSLLNLCNW